MGTRILEGVRVNECDKPGAVFYDSTEGLAFGPVFDSAEEAECFLHFIAGADPRTLGWSTRVESTGYTLYKLWLSCGKPANRPAVQLDETCLSKNDPEAVGHEEWGIACNLVEHCFPLFKGYNNHEVADVLKEAGVIGEGAVLDCEHSCFYAYFKSQRAAEQFLWRLNGWLRENWQFAYSLTDGGKPPPKKRKSKK